MNYLKELPPGTIWPHLIDAIRAEVAADIKRYAESRAADVERGAETPALAALLVDKYCDGLCRALAIVGVDSDARSLADRLVRSLDSNFDAHRQARFAARPADLTFAGPTTIN